MVCLFTLGLSNMLLIDWVQLKLMYKGSASLLSVKAGISLRDLKRKVRKEFRMRMDLQFEDQDV